VFQRAKMMFPKWGEVRPRQIDELRCRCVKISETISEGRVLSVDGVGRRSSVSWCLSV
jgi:hypothetical protein